MAVDYSADANTRALFVALTFFLCTTVVTSCLRVLKIILEQKGRPFVHDYLMGISVLFFSAMCAFAYKGLEVSQAKHLAELSAQQAERTMMWWKATQLSYIASTLLLRLSLSLLLLQILTMPSRNPLLRLALLATTTTTTLYSTAYFLLALLQCRPVAYFWTSITTTNRSGKCIAPPTFALLTYLYSALTILSDILLSSLPLFFVPTLQMPRRTKILACIVLGLGGVASIAVVARVPFIVRLAAHAASDAEFPYYAVNVVLCSVVECGLGILCANVATARAVVGRLGCWVRLGYFGRRSADGTAAGGEGEGMAMGVVEGARRESSLGPVLMESQGSESVRGESADGPKKDE